MNKAEFAVDRDKCVGCGRCINVCPGGVLRMVGGAPVIDEFDDFGWNGCWKCGHCLAVCPVGARSVLGKHPEDSLPPPENAAVVLDALIANRRSCRRYQRRNVDRAVIDGMLAQLRLDHAAHRALHDAGPDPVLVIGEPFFGQRLVQHFGQFLYVEVQNLRSLLFHRLAFLVENVCVDYCKDCAKQQRRHMDTELTSPP